MQVGDIFAVQLPDKKFCYGKVIAPAAKLPRIQEGFFSVMMSNIVTNTLDEVTFELNESSILLSPWIVNETFWRNGTFFTISRKPLTNKEKDLKIGYVVFDAKKHLRGERGWDLYDINGNLIEKADYYTFSGYTTIHGMEFDLYREKICGTI